ncbi:Chitinase [Fusarium sp. Ph1]|nr:Chitinase [Fusarium sp. Ph1]
MLHFGYDWSSASLEFCHVSLPQVVSDQISKNCTCEWGLYPNCDAQDECRNPNGDLTKNQVWARSASGSGGGKCDTKQNPFGLNIPGTQFRRFCCSVQPNLRFEDCRSYKDVGPASNPHPNGFCRSGCPSDRVRVALDTEVDTCAVAGGKGGMATRCKTSYSDAFEVENPKLDAARSVIKEWIDNPTCPKQSSTIFRRADQLDGVVGNASLATELASRDDKTHDITPLVILTSLLSGSQNDGPEETARRIICSPYSYNARIAAAEGKDSGGSTKWINCTYAVCDKDGVCGDGDDEIVARRRRALLPTRSTHLSTKHHMLHVRQAKPKETHLDLDPGNGQDIVRIDFDVPQHDPPRKLEEKKHPAVENTAEYGNPDDCSDTRLKPDGGTFDGSKDYHTEHPVDKSVLLRFFSAATTGELESGRTPRYGPIPIEFLEDMQWLGLRDEFWPEITGNPDFEDGNMYSRVMECLGSQTNNRNFAVAIGDLNWANGRVRISSMS